MDKDRRESGREPGERKQLPLVSCEGKEENRTVTSKKEVRKDFFVKVGENPAIWLELDTIKMCVYGSTVSM